MLNVTRSPGAKFVPFVEATVFVSARSNGSSTSTCVGSDTSGTGDPVTAESAFTSAIFV